MCRGGVVADRGDAEWAALAPHVPAWTGRGRPIIYLRRDIVDAIRYLDRQPSAALVDSQSLRGAETVGRTSRG